MNFKNLIVALLALLTATGASAFSLKLRAIDSQGDPEAYATCRIYSATDSTRSVAAGITDSLGYYKATLPSAGNYRVILEVPGKDTAARQFSLSDTNPDTDLGDMTSGVSELGEIVVTAQRPLVVRELDRIGYDVQADEDSKTVTVNEILKKVPMVNVDSEGNITINGSSDFKIYKNGRPNSSMSKNAKELFKALPASMIKKIEVITEPGAAYDAEGVAAILNIVTLENTVIKGVMGTASAHASTLNPLNGANLWLTSQIDKVTFSLNGGMFHQNKNISDHTNTEDYIYDNGSHRESTNTGNTSGYGGYGGLELSWEPDTLNLFTIEGNMFSYGVKPEGAGSMSFTDADGNIISSYNSRYYYPKYKYIDLDMTAAYQRSTRRKGETFTLSYQLSTNNNSSLQNTEYTDIIGSSIPYTAIYKDYKLNFIEHTFQFDWTRPISKIHTLDVGAKYIARRNSSKDNSQYVGWQDRFTDFRHITDIAALYAQYSVKINKVSLRAGLRYEFSKLKASYPSPSIPAGNDKPYTSNLNDWVPTAAASWNINDANSLSLNYSTRINRPGIQYLNPAASISPTEISMGNPDLESARHQSFKLQYMLMRPKATVNFSVRYSWTNNSISSLEYLKDNIIYSTYGNVGRTRDLTFNGFGQFSFGSKTRMMINFAIGRNDNRWDGYRLARWYYRGWFSLTQKLPWQIEAEASLWIQPQWVDGVYSYNSTSLGNRLFPSLSLKRSFLKDNRLSVRIGLHNITGKRTSTYSYINGPYTGKSTFRNEAGITGMLSISYRFGSLNAQVKKVKNAISNDDLEGQGKKSGGN